jgi:hypothetical protein
MHQDGFAGDELRVEGGVVIGEQVLLRRDQQVLGLGFRRLVLFTE